MRAGLAAALDHEPQVRRHFDELSHSNRRRHVLPTKGGKTAATPSISPSPP